MSRPLTASLSLDLDNQWSYMRTHGDPGWETYPSYLPEVLPRALDAVEAAGLRMTVFLVGQDASRPDNAALLRSIPARGHEVGNHSMNHLQWLHRLPEAELEAEIADAEHHIEAATGERPRGFRGPGFACSETLLRILARRGYTYDCSTFPTFLGPLARAYYFMSSRRLSQAESEQRKDLFGGVRDGLRPLHAYEWDLGAGGTLLEIPVTTMPLLRAPIHMSYVLYLGQRSPGLARLYLRTALRLCALRGVEPSFLLHPLDLVSGDTCPALRFFPAMGMPTAAKRALLAEALGELRARFDVVPMGEHARRLRARGQAARDGSAGPAGNAGSLGQIGQAGRAVPRRQPDLFS